MQSLADSINASNRPSGVWCMLVGPYGQVRHLEVMPHIGGDVFVELDRDGEPRIPKRYREEGWCFYEQICDGSHDGTGTSQEQGAKHLKAWEALRAAFASGRRPGRGAVDTERFYHPEIWRRRSLERPDDMSPIDAAELFGELASEMSGEPKKAKVTDGRAKSRG